MNTNTKKESPSQTKRALSQVKISFIRQIGNVLLKSITAALSRALGRHR